MSDKQQQPEGHHRLFVKNQKVKQVLAKGITPTKLIRIFDSNVNDSTIETNKALANSV